MGVLEALSLIPIFKQSHRPSLSLSIINKD